jgi:8-oxo-dGTP pyrophosphatase MutT (NUDIX family)
MQERSAGTVLFNENDGKVEYLLLHYPTGHWDFAKGHIEEDEAELETVRREIKEETSIDNIEFMDGFRRKIVYNYKRRGKLVNKEVIFYLAKTNTKNVKLSFEHQGYRWLTYDDAMKVLTYKNAKMILEEANKFLSSIKGKS